ncbi:hypothetical protein CR203_00020 [Salipaludibacillus neizhouensis]|uniref:Uncharacterized protein n=1 Tax=Salipaludibacillus neizhouensis TaxID=885475 RepID=A0A3A9KD71_9BACI|nr:hypothetical protein CR203_00020 [Salipaludibacillus neizhouensis]
MIGMERKKLLFSNLEKAGRYTSENLQKSYLSKSRSPTRCQGLTPSSFVATGTLGINEFNQRHSLKIIIKDLEETAVLLS